jgi:molybdenum cofactor biosynthesis protein B
MPIDETRVFLPLRIAVLVVSDTRSLDDDRSGAILVELATAAGHIVVERALVRDEQPAIERAFIAYAERDDVQIVISTGGTGITGRDVTPEALEAIVDKRIAGFGELFRALSFATIGTSAIQSRATAGVRATTLFFALPGSTGAVRDGWNGILATQLDARYRPCNFAELLPRLGER